MGTETPLTLRLVNPHRGNHGGGYDYFLGAWSPDRELDVQFQAAPGSTVRSLASGRWFLLSETSPLHTPVRALVHATGDEPSPLAAVAFRGYLLEPPVHGWCDSQSILDYWANPPERHNGLFAAARLLRDNSLELITDAFGIAPLYYRVWNGVVLFSTDGQLLEAQGDAFDPLAGRAFLQAGSLFGDRTFTVGVERVPPGRRLAFRGSTTPFPHRWFSYSSLPPGDQPIDDDGVREVEESFQNAMDRCLRLPAAQRILPLSSGYDSRRILAALQSRQTSFKALTLRIIQKGHRDLDATWASAMARAFGFDHNVIELADPLQYADDDSLLRSLTDSQTTEHSWIMPLMRHLPPESALIFDGLGGDIFNTTGYEIREMYACAEEQRLPLVAGWHFGPGELDHNLSPALWPGISELRGHLEEYVADLPYGKNRGDYIYLRMRARHSTGLWSHTVVPAGHVAVHPYFDLDCASVALKYDPLDKIERFLQDRCLARFWPEYHVYPGSRRVPADATPGDGALLQKIQATCLRQLFAEVGAGPWYGDLRRWLSPRGYALMFAAAHNESIGQRVNWWMRPLLSLKARERNCRPCWFSSAGA